MAVKTVVGITISLLVYVPLALSTPCPPSGCPTQDTDDVELIQKRIDVESSLQLDQGTSAATKANTTSVAASLVIQALREAFPTTGAREYLTGVLEEERNKIGGVPTSKDMRIPCKIVQTYSSPLGSLPETMEQARLTWERLNPEYEYHYMTDADMLLYVQMKGRWLPGLIETFSALTMPAEKADVFRFLYIYNEGGVYADIDTALRKPMREVLQPTDQFVVFSMDKDAGLLEGFWFAAAQYHPLLKHLLERIVDEIRGHTILANGTCTDCPLYPFKIAGPHQLTRAATDLLFPEVSKTLPPRLGNEIPLPPSAWHHFVPGTFANAENTFHVRVPGFVHQQDAIIPKYRGYDGDLDSTNNTYWKKEWEERNASLRKQPE